jgi:hypothetical protein
VCPEAIWPSLLHPKIRHVFARKHDALAGAAFHNASQVAELFISLDPAPA